MQGLQRLQGLVCLELHGMRCMDDLGALRGLPRLREFSGWFESLDLRHLPAGLTKLVVMGVVGRVSGMPGLAAPPGEDGQAGQHHGAAEAAAPPQQAQQPEQQQAEQQQAEQQQPEQPHQYPALRHLTLVFEEDGHWELEVLTQRMQFLALLGPMLPSLRHLAVLTQLPYHLQAMPAAISPPSNGEVGGEAAAPALPPPWHAAPGVCIRPGAPVCRQQRARPELGPHSCAPRRPA
jgi:hypothetical protein